MTTDDTIRLAQAVATLTQVQSDHLDMLRSLSARVDALEAKRAPKVRTPRAPLVTVSDDARAWVCGALSTAAPGKTIGEIKTDIHATEDGEAVIKRTLAVLLADGTAIKEGQKRGTRYRLAATV